MIQFTLISFLAGLLTALAPCILPLLPVIIGGSVAGATSIRKAFIVVLSLGVSVFLFTIALKVSTAFITVPAIAWQILSGGLLIFFGIVTIFPSVWDRIPGVSALYTKSNQVLGKGYGQQNIFGDILVGAALGPVFSSCSPTYFVILAAVLPAHFAEGVVYLIAYVVGLSMALFVIAFLGQKAIEKLGIVTGSNGWFKPMIGILFVAVGVAVMFGFDKTIEASLPATAFGELGLEQQLLSHSKTSMPSSTKDRQYQTAPELVHPDGYINTNGQPITISQFKGKDVVLVDFWDYSCINCQRTFPYLKAWYQKYKDQGLVIIGVHTPEFAFEHLQSNVEAAAQRFGLTYPIVLDNEYATWNAFQNEYWPREYLIDIDGYIVHDHAGEGDYQETEQAIQQALAERATRLGMGPVASSTVNVQEADLSGIGSPETYFGSNRNSYLGNGEQGTPGMQTFTLTQSPRLNTLYLGGQWNITPEYAEAGSGSKILYKYSAHDVYIVATNVSSSVRIKVMRDGQPVGAAAGADVDAKTGEATIQGDRLYTLIHDPSAGTHTIEIEIEEGTLDAYTFTFG